MNLTPHSPFKVSEDRKTSMFRSHKNATGHSALTGCPGATYGEGGCATVCYVHLMTRIRPKVKSALEYNMDLLVAAQSKDDYIQLLEPGVIKAEEKYRRKMDKIEKKRDKESKRLHRQLSRGHIYRWHWSGDVLNRPHAESLRDIARKHPATTFWIYTRTWWIAPLLLGERNLIVNLSVDPVNESQMRAIWGMQNQEPQLRLAWMGDNPPEWIKNPVTCPAAGKHAKMDWQYACSKCRLCLHQTNRYNVVFPIH